jgi:hypothetical protein
MKTMEQSYILLKKEDIEKIQLLLAEASKLVGQKLIEVNKTISDSIDKSSIYEDLHTISEELKARAQNFKAADLLDVEGKYLESAQLLQKAAHNLLV